MATLWHESGCPQALVERHFASLAYQGLVRGLRLISGAFGVQVAVADGCVLRGVRACGLATKPSDGRRHVLSIRIGTVTCSYILLDLYSGCVERHDLSFSKRLISGCWARAAHIAISEWSHFILTKWNFKDLFF